MFIFVNDLKEGSDARACDAGGAEENGACAMEVFQLLLHFMESHWGLHGVFTPRYYLIRCLPFRVFEV